MNEFSIKIELSGNQDGIEHVDIVITGNKPANVASLVAVMWKNAEFAELITGAANTYKHFNPDLESDSDG